MKVIDALVRYTARLIVAAIILIVLFWIILSVAGSAAR